MTAGSSRPADAAGTGGGRDGGGAWLLPLGLSDLVLGSGAFGWAGRQVVGGLHDADLLEVFAVGGFGVAALLAGALLLGSRRALARSLRARLLLGVVGLVPWAVASLVAAIVAGLGPAPGP